LLSGFLGAL
jgi:hypothetical protein